MVNKQLFSSRSASVSPADAINEAGGTAYALPPKHALAQLAATGYLGNTYYASAEQQLDTMLKFVALVDDNTFLAKLAVYARQKAFMKDMPAALVAILARRDTVLMHRIFNTVIDNGRMLRTLFQMVRSGKFGSRSMSSSLNRAMRSWILSAHEGKLLSASIGNDPALRDILRLIRPKPNTNAQRATLGWLVGRDPAKWAPASPADLPDTLQRLIAYRQASTPQEQLELLHGPMGLPVRWDLLADAAKGAAVWAAIAKQMGHQALRMNLNTLLRHQVFLDPAMVKFVAEKLRSADEVRQARQFPYQYLAAYMNMDAAIPHVIRQALHAATEIACGNIPELPGPVAIGLDVSGSMRSAMSDRSSIHCVDVAALFASAILRRNPDSIVIPFDQRTYDCRVDPSDSILSLAERLAKFGGGGTDCSLPIILAGSIQRRLAGLVLVSDNQSWINNQAPASSVATSWREFRVAQRKLGNASPKLICIDLQPYATVQAPEASDTLNVGGFSDAVFSVVASFLTGASGFVAEVEAVEI